VSIDTNMIVTADTTERVALPVYQNQQTPKHYPRLWLRKVVRVELLGLREIIAATSGVTPAAATTFSRRRTSSGPKPATARQHQHKRLVARLTIIAAPLNLALVGALGEHDSKGLASLLQDFRG
jgi:hypothetical protein